MGDPLWTLSDPKTNYMISLDNFSTTSETSNLRVSLDRAHQDQKLGLKSLQYSIIFFSTICINKLLYPYAVTPDLLIYAI